jgi:hypothetical protein
MAGPAGLRAGRPGLVAWVCSGHGVAGTLALTHACTNPNPHAVVRHHHQHSRRHSHATNRKQDQECGRHPGPVVLVSGTGQELRPGTGRRRPTGTGTCSAAGAPGLMRPPVTAPLSAPSPLPALRTTRKPQLPSTPPSLHSACCPLWGCGLFRVRPRVVAWMRDGERGLSGVRALRVKAVPQRSRAPHTPPSCRTGGAATVLQATVLQVLNPIPPTATNKISVLMGIKTTYTSTACSDATQSSLQNSLFTAMNGLAQFSLVSAPARPGHGPAGREPRAATPCATQGGGRPRVLGRHAGAQARACGRCRTFTRPALRRPRIASLPAPHTRPR